MAMRVYLDASVFGGCFDAEFEPHGSSFFEELRIVDAVALISDTLVLELGDAPTHAVNGANGYGNVVIMTPRDVYNVWKESENG